MKDNFLLKKSQINVFKELSNEDAGKLIKGIFDYSVSGEITLDGYLKIIFLPIKEEIDKNEEKYEMICERNRNNGRLGGRPKETQENPKNPSGFEENPKKPINHNHNNIINNNILYNNIDNNSNIDNNIEKENIKRKRIDEQISKIIEYLNNKLNSKYRSSTKSTKEKINARLKEGFTYDDFLCVIDKKYNEWKGTEFEKYLCPETLFGTKFEKYLNQKDGKNKSTPNWFDKDIQVEEATTEEQEMMKDWLSDFK